MLYIFNQRRLITLDGDDMRKRSLPQSLKRIFAPGISPEIQWEIDKGNIRNMYLISFIVLCLETVMLAIFILTHLNGFGDEEMGGVLRNCFCVLVCSLNILITTRLQKKENYAYRIVTAVSVTDFVLMSFWGILTSALYHTNGGQFLSFYAVILCFICFITYRPLVSCFLTLWAFAGLWLMTRLMDVSDTLNIFNYLVMMVLTAVGMIHRYDQQIKVSRSFLELQAMNRDLSHASRHDTLTGLRNREALAEDREQFYGHPLTVILADIDYFKLVNDVHGHAVGDRVLQEVGRFLHETYADSHVYRYGGDEFLAVLQKAGSPAAEGENRTLTVAARGGVLDIHISIGTASGVIQDEMGFLSLIAQADGKLYGVKRVVHAEDEPLDLSRDRAIPAGRDE